MKRLRHPVRAIREPFGKAGLIVAVVALVAALVGGAYAATGSGKRHHKKSNNTTALVKRESKKWSKKFSKQFAVPGATGPQGPAGSNGNDGAAGAQGDKGDTGAAGSNGTNGTSATATAFAGAQHGCTEGGVEVKSASAPAYLCNGEKGAAGQTGFTETLPSGKTETGAWSTSRPASGEAAYFVTASFNIPLEEAPTVVYNNPGSAECPGGPTAPLAAPGYLCFYPALQEGIGGSPILSSEGFTSGGVIAILTEEMGFAFGTWAVTAE